MTNKLCSRCNEEKPLEEFSPGARMKTGKRSWCKDCGNKYALEYYHSNKEKLNAARQTRRAKDYGRAYHLKRVFGITLEQYEELLNKQGRKCAICQKTEDQEKRAFAVDHSHKTGHIRGLLCFSCNKNVIGRHTDPDIFLRASEYLRTQTDWIVPEQFLKGTTKRRKRKKKIDKSNT